MTWPAGSDDVGDLIRDVTDGRGPDSVIDADDDPLGVDGFATHRVPLSEAPAAYEMFQKKEDGAVKVIFSP